MGEVSVVMGTCNGAAFVRRQVLSILGQRLRPSELVITDDASTDSTIELITELDAPADLKVRILRGTSRVGIAANFTRGLAAATSAFVALCDQDDEWHVDKLAAQVPLMASAEVMAVCSDARLVSTDGRPLGQTYWERTGFSRSNAGALEQAPLSALLRTNPITGNSMLFRREVVERALPIPEGAMHDYWLLLFAALMGEIALIPRPLLDYRQHESNAIGVGPRPGIRSGFARRPGAPAWSELEMFRMLGARLNEEAWVKGGDRALVASKLRFLERRERLPSGTVRRIPRVLELLREPEGYRRYGRGVGSAVADVLAAPSQRRS